MGFLRQLVRAVKKHGLVAVLRDVPYPYKTIDVDVMGWDRKWKYVPTIERRGWSFFEIGLEMYLTQYKGASSNALAEYTYVQCRLRDWHWPKQEHLYYDGPHCGYYFGPFQVHTHWGNCEKCYDGR